MEYVGKYEGYKCYKAGKGDCAIERNDNIYLVPSSSGYKMYLWETEVGHTDKALNIEWFTVPIGVQREVSEYRKLKEVLFSIEPEEKKEGKVATAKTANTTKASTTVTTELNFDSKTWYEKELNGLLKDFNYDIAVG